MLPIYVPSRDCCRRQLQRRLRQRRAGMLPTVLTETILTPMHTHTHTDIQTHTHTDADTHKRTRTDRHIDTHAHLQRKYFLIPTSLFIQTNTQACVDDSDTDISSLCKQLNSIKQVLRLQHRSGEPAARSNASPSSMPFKTAKCSEHRHLGL